MNNQQRDWKEKYFATLKDLDEREHSWRKIERVFRIGLNRLAILSQDGHSELDRPLHKIRTLARGTDNSSALATAVESLGKPLAESGFDSSDSKVISAISTVSQLLPFNEKQQADLDTACAKGDHNRSLKLLVREIGNLVQAEVGIKQNVLAKTLVNLLDQLQHPEIGDQKLTLLRQQISEATTQRQWQAAIESTIEQIQYELQLLSEKKKKLLLFISQLTDRLANFERLALAGMANMEKAHQCSTDISNSLSDELSGLVKNVSSSSDIYDIKTQVSQRITSALENMERYFEQETEYFEKATVANRKLEAELVKARSESDQLRRALEESREKQMRDALTQVSNRHAYEEHLALEISRHHRNEKPLTYVLWDIDHFKSINDKHGHAAGDAVLKAVAQIMQKSIRKTDFLARIGGEEFSLLLPGTSIEESDRLCNSIREEIAARNYSYKGETFSVSASCGYTRLQGDDEASSVYERADSALYKAKKSGRNCCVCADTPRNAA